MALSKTMKERDGLLVKIKNLQGELRSALMAAEDISALKSKLVNSCNHLDNEKMAHLRTVGEVDDIKRTKMCYADHLENMITGLKLLSKSKLRIAGAYRDLRKKKKLADFENNQMRRKNAAKDKLIADLRENNQVLNNQLKLMDEQLLYCKKNIDGVRTEQRTTVARASKESKVLRNKFAQATGHTLDDIRLTNVAGLDTTDASIFGKFQDNHGGGEFSPPSPGKVRPKSAGPVEKSPLKRVDAAPTLGRLVSNSNSLGMNNNNNKQELEPLAVHIGEMSQRQKDVAMEVILEKVDHKRRKQTGENKAWEDTSIRALASARDSRPKGVSSSPVRPKSAAAGRSPAH